MPVYIYNCGDCGTTADYFVRKMGQTPEGCSDCSSSSLKRTYSGQGFAYVASRTLVRFDGEVNESDQNEFPDQQGLDRKLAPGIHVTAGISEEGRPQINVFRVTESGCIDASVTGVQKLDG